MTREKMAERLHSLSGFAHASEFDVLSSAAAELRKTCATCCWFRLESWHMAATDKRKEMSGIDSDCHAWDCEGKNVPADGSGFCHRWEPKP